MKQPEADARTLRESLAAHTAAALRSGLRLAWRGQSAAAQPATPAAETLQAIRADLGDCRRCGLWEARSTIVFGSGDPRARLMFVGSAPSAADDAEGSPFCGLDGELLTKIIGAIGLSRRDVYLTHIVKCSPPGGRPPVDNECGCCSEFLFRQIAAIGPAVVCALGEQAARFLLSTAEPLARLRGRFQEVGGYPLMATNDPGSLHSNQAKKRETWEDMKMIMNLLG